MIDNSLFGFWFGWAWVALCMFASALAVLRGPSHGSWSSKSAGLPFALIAAFALRAIPTVLLNRGVMGDTVSYGIVGHLVLSGRDVYVTPSAWGRYPYLPLHLYLSAAAVLVSSHLHLPFVVIAKIPAVLADVALVPAVAFALKRHGGEAAASRRAAWIYAVNPVTIIVVAYHGQFDSIPLLFVVLAWAILEPGKSARDMFLAGGFLGVAILSKSWPILLLPVFMLSLPRRRALMVLSAATLVPTIATAQYLVMYQTPLRTFARIVIGYGSSPGWWGIGFLVKALGASQPTIHLVSRLSEVAVIVLVGAYLWRSHGARVRERCLAVVLLFSVLSAGFALQYLMWPVPFLALCTHRVPAPRLLSVLVLAGLLSAFADLVGGGMYGLATAGIRSTVGAMPFLCLWLLLGWLLLCVWRTRAAQGVPSAAN